MTVDEATERLARNPETIEMLRRGELEIADGVILKLELTDGEEDQ